MDHLFLKLAFLIYKKHLVSYTVFNRIKDLSIQDYPQKVLDALQNKDCEEFVTQEIEKAHKNKVRIIPYDGDDYPNHCKSYKSMPPVLYSLGNLPFREHAVGIVGSRKATAYGIKETIEITTRLTNLDFVIVSGLAYGIDSQAHKSCLQQNGTTYAVLGCGVDIDYPYANRKLKEEIIASGMVISEFPMGTAPLSYHFPVRNRIISALSKYIIVIEASQKSGALITADYGLDQGKEILALPGNIDQLSSVGTNQLIKSGAVMVNDMESLDEFLVSQGEILPIGKNKKSSYKGSSPLETDLIKMIQENLYSTSEIIDQLDYSSHEISQSISILEMRGYIQEVNGSWVWI